MTLFLDALFLDAPFFDALADLALGATCAACGRPGRVLCPSCLERLPDAAMPVSPDPCPPGLAPVYAAGWYADPLRTVILAHKERRAFALSDPLGRVLAAVIMQVVAQIVPPGPATVVLVPVPSRRSVVRARGHDPVLRMVRAAARRLRPEHAVLVSPLLRQRDRVADQAGLGAIARGANLVGALGVVPRRRRALARSRRPVRVLVCDDIITTGATAREAQRALEDAGVPVAGIVTLAATRRRGGHSRAFATALPE